LPSQRLAFHDLQKGLSQRGVGHVPDFVVTAQADVFFIVRFPEILSQPAHFAGGANEDVIDVHPAEGVIFVLGFEVHVHKIDLS